MEEDGAGETASLALMEKRQGEMLRTDDSVAEKLAGGVSPSEDLETDGV